MHTTTDIDSYGRVSTRDQNPDAQTDALHAAGCEEFYVDKASGKLARRPELDRALLRARTGDKLVITKLDGSAAAATGPPRRVRPGPPGRGAGPPADRRRSMTGHQRERQAELKNRFAALIRPAEPASAEPASAEPAAAHAAVPKAAGRKTAAKTQPRQSSQPAPAAVAPMPIVQAVDETRPKRLMVPLSVDEDRVLKEYRLADSVPAAARVRAMLQLYREDERFRRRVDEVAKRMR